MSRRCALHVTAAVALIFGLGCGTGGGCGGLRPLPTDPKPFGFPADQIIEGGIQARITRPGMDKLMGALPTLFAAQLKNGFCAQEDTNIFNFLGQRADACLQPSAVCSMNTGCSAYVYLNSKDRPATFAIGDVMPPPAANNQDNKLGFTVSLNDSPPAAKPIVTVDGKIDVLVPIKLSTQGPAYTGNCHIYVHTTHIGDNNGDPLHIVAQIALGTDATTGELSLTLANLDIPTLGITTDSEGGAVCDFISGLSSGILGFIDVIPDFIKSFIINNLLLGPINNLLQGLLPKPLGLAGTFNAGAVLASFNPPADTNLEMFIVPGGYVHSGAGGLTLGVMSGLNSDRDQTTRTPGLTSEPSLCVPTRPTPDLSSPPWNLPFNTPRKDYTLNAAAEFSGNPDPVDATGALQDVAIGISRTFLDLAGFHIYNSGTLCLSIGGSAIPQLNAGTLSVVIGSLGNILEDRKAPLALVLRPETPINFTLGAGDMMDPLIHVAVSDMRIDFYAWIEERYVRLFTLGVDVNVGLNMTIGKDSMMRPTLQPMLVGLDASNITIRVTNTDLLQEKPADLAMVFPSLINIATGALGGAFPAIPLPAVSGFSLDSLSVSRVQTSQDDFLGIFGTIVAGSPSALIDWSDPMHPHLAGELDTQASVERLDVPTAAELRALFSAKPAAPATPVGRTEPTVRGRRPELTLRLAASGGDGRPVEYGWRIDGGIWRPWTQENRPVLRDDAFLLQGRHTIDVRSRAVGDWKTEDATPAHLEVLIDSVPPELHPARDPDHADRVTFGGWDVVSPDSALEYAWIGSDGMRTAWSHTDSLTRDQVAALTDEGSHKLVMYARDEAGNVLEQAVDLGPLLGFHGRTTNPSTSGCSCDVGGAGGSSNNGTLYLLGALVALVWLRRRATAALGLVALGALALHAAGCGCEEKGPVCVVDDDCAKMKCMPGQLPQCQTNACACVPDIGPGDSGRFSSMALIGSDAYVASYNNTYGDLMIGHVTPPAVIKSWDFVDGVPLDPPDVPNSHVRGGIPTKGDDVGRYTSIQATPTNEPVMAYYDKTHGALKFASFGVIRWHSHVIDKGATTPDADNGDDVGRWASMSLAKDGTPGIAYTAIVHTGTMSGMPEGQLRWAQAKVKNPQQTSDWAITIVDSRPLPVDAPAAPAGDGGASDDAGAPAEPPDVLLPESIALMASVARKSDGNPAIAYYDRTRGNLRYTELVPSAGGWSTPIILDGEDADGNDTGDVGLYTSLAFDAADVAQISYVDATRDNLMYINSMDMTREIVDDGYRPADEQTLDGLDAPVYHLVGDSSSIQASSGKIVIAYQDSTIVSLRVAVRGMDGKWVSSSVAGHDAPFKGSYGFYASMRVLNGRGVISTYAVNQQLDNPMYYVEVFAVDLGLIM